MYKPTTIKDIALALRLSASTVSRALRDGYEISPETKHAVVEYAKKVNYQVNPIALGLKNRRSYSIGIVVPELANSFISQAIAGIESITYEKGYHAIIAQTNDSAERELISVEHLAQRSVDGLLISMSSGTIDYNFLKTLHANGMPIVFFDKIIDEINTFKVTSDNFNATLNAVELLISSGHKKIAFLAGAPQLSITSERLSGYKKALDNYNIGVRPEMIKFCGNGGGDCEDVEDVIKDLLSMPDKPDAIFAGDDRNTIGCIRALRNIGAGLPKISIIGFSNSDTVDLLKPSISYIRQNAFEMGTTAAKMLLKVVESRFPITDFEKKLLDTEYVANDNMGRFAEYNIYKAS